MARLLTTINDVLLGSLSEIKIVSDIDTDGQIEQIDRFKPKNKRDTSFGKWRFYLIFDHISRQIYKTSNGFNYAFFLGQSA